MDLAKMSIEELEDFLHSTDDQIQDLREQKRAAHERLDELNLAAEAERKFANMSTPERRALLQHMHLEGVDSEEQVTG